MWLLILMQNIENISLRVKFYWKIKLSMRTEWITNTENQMMAELLKNHNLDDRENK